MRKLSWLAKVPVAIGVAQGLVAAFVLAGAAEGQTTQDLPVLRIETGMHTATIHAIAADREERYLVSGADDKTARVWDLATGNLLRILRPPVGPGNVGKLDGVAISPDGAVVACGGWTTGESKEYLYLFDRETGRLIRRIPGLPSVAKHLAYSRNGEYLAVTLGNKSGLRVYRTSDYSQVGEDPDYGDDTYGLAFSPTLPRRIATASYDGYVRVYSQNVDGSLRLQAKQPAPGGNKPWGVAFSPDGARVAIGFDGSPTINVLSAAGLTLEYSPNTTGLTGSLITVAWTAAGNFLYAGGQYRNGATTPIVQWAEGGRGARREFAGGDDTVMGLVALRNGSVAFGTGNPDLGVLSSAGNKLWFHGPSICVYRSGTSLYPLSRDGTRVGFSYEWHREVPAWFSLKDRLLTVSRMPTGDGVVTPVTEGMPVTDWRNSYSPKLNGKVLPISKYEFSYSLAVAPDKRSFLLGTTYRVRCFDASGKQLWEVPGPDVAWTVNITSDGQLAVVEFGDGTIRWYRYDNGKELLAFFPHPDRKRWVMWSPSGYYDASPGGEDLIGWHLNHGWDTSADFFPASRFRSTFYRPDVVARLLATRDEKLSLQQADAEAGRRRTDDSITHMLPPVVTLLGPAEGSEFSGNSVKVRYSLRNPSGEPVTAVRALVDGRPVSAARTVVPVVGDTRELDVAVPGQNCEVSLIAENRFSVSEPVSVHLRWRGAAAAFTIQPKLYVLAVGISAYRAPYQLSFPAKDARDFVNALLPQKGKLYRDIEAKLIVDTQATKENILDGLEWLERSTTQHDVAMVFLSGHGDNDARSSTYYFMPVNFDVNRLKATAIAQSDIMSTVQTLQGKALFFVDTCHSGNVMGGRARAVAADLNALVNELSSAENGAVVFAASSGRQVAVERDEWGNGAFTKALVEGLSGRAAIGGARITVNMLDLYISERVKQLTGGQQTPTTTKPKTINDFPVAIAK